jgi:hypothetical protein
MQDVYSNAFLNLAATAARDGDDGCFIPRNSLFMDWCFVQSESLDGNTNRPGLQIHVHEFDDWTRNIDEALLNSRAWVVQERALSRRILHFTSRQLYWECCQETFKESNTTYLSSQDQYHIFKDAVNMKSLRHSRVDYPENQSDMYKSWSSIVGLIPCAE